MTATQGFLAAWKSGAARQPVALLEITLENLIGGSDVVLRAATSDVIAGGLKYDPLIAGSGSIKSPGGFLSTDVLLASASASLIANRRASFQPEGELLAKTMADYRWIGAPVKIFLWDETLNGRYFVRPTYPESAGDGDQNTSFVAFSVTGPSTATNGYTFGTPPTDPNSLRVESGGRTNMGALSILGVSFFCSGVFNSGLFDANGLAASVSAMRMKWTIGANTSSAAIDKFAVYPSGGSIPTSISYRSTAMQLVAPDGGLWSWAKIQTWLTSATAIRVEADYVLGAAEPLSMMLIEAGAVVHLRNPEGPPDSLARFRGVIQTASVSTDTIDLTMLQDRLWNRPLNLTTVTKQAFPQAPENSVGATVPIIYGAVPDTPYRDPWPANPVAENPIFALRQTSISKLRGGRRVASAILVDTGRGGGSGLTNPKAKVLVASHKCKTVADFSRGAGMFMESNGKLVAIEPKNMSTRGSSFHAWESTVGGITQVFVGKFDPDGVPLWGVAGVQVSAATAATVSARPLILADGAGGIWVSFAQDTGTGDKVYVNRVASSGVVQFPGGLRICNATGDHGNVSMISCDGAADALGGIIVLWEDGRTIGTTGLNVYGVRISDPGVVPVLSWAADGSSFCTAASAQQNIQACSDAAGGVIAAWTDFRAAPTDVFVQRANANGNGLWTAHGIQISTHSGNQQYPCIVPDGAGGAYLSWDDTVTLPNIAIQRINSSGAAQWTAGGVQVTTAGNASQSRLFADSTGVYVAWFQFVAGVGKIYVQKYNTSGTAQWAAGGVQIGTGFNPLPPWLDGPVVCSDESGGIIVAWPDGNTVYARRVNSAGTTQWNATANGSVCGSTSFPEQVRIASRGDGGAIVNWCEGQTDIRGAQIKPDGTVYLNGYVATTAAVERWNAIAEAGDGDLINEAGAAGFTLTDSADVAYYNAPPVVVDFVTNSAENPRAIIDPWNDINYAKLDYTAGYRDLRFGLEDPPDLGKMTHVYFVLGYASASNTGLKLRITDTSSALPTPYQDYTLAATGGALKWIYFGVGDAYTPLWGVVPLPSSPWNLGSLQLDLGWFGGGGDAGTAQIYGAEICVRYIPKQSVVEAERTVASLTTRPTVRQDPGASSSNTPYGTSDLQPAITEQAGKFFANVEGMMDDFAGTYSGTSFGLIERAPDVLRHLLRNYGGVATGNILNTGGVNGSFLDARALLKTRRNADTKIGLSIGESVDVMTAISWITNSCLTMPVLSEFDGKWRLFPWVEGQANTTAAIRVDDILGENTFSAKMTPDSQVASTIRVAYGWDAQSRSYRHETVAGALRSLSGHEYRNLRDQYLTVVAGVNDRLDYLIASSVVRSAVLTPGSYTGPEFAVQLEADATAVSAGWQFIASWGCGIKAGWNSTFQFTSGTLWLTMDLAAEPGLVWTTTPTGQYTTFASMEALATAITNRMNAATIADIGAGGPACTWLCYYSRVDGKFGFTFSSPVALARTFRCGTGATLANRRLLSAVGFDCIADVSSASGTSGSFFPPFKREEERISLWSSGVTDYYFRTGVYGSAGLNRGCWELIGFDGLRDQTNGTRNLFGLTPKNNLENLMLTESIRYGLKRDVSVEGRGIYDTETARELRDRIAAFMLKPRVIVSFSSDRLPDLERGARILFDYDLDRIIPYPGPGSDGSWSGKIFMVTEILQNFGSAWHTEIVAVQV